MKKLLSIILAITITLTLFASCGKAEKALISAELLDLGEKYLLDLDYEQAIVYFNQVIEVEPRNSRAYMGAAEAYIGLGDTESAINILKTALDVFSDNEEVTIELLEMLIEIDPTTAEWYLELAQIYVNEGDIDSAMDILEQGIAVVDVPTELQEMWGELSSGQAGVSYSSPYSYLFTTAIVSNSDLGIGTLVLVNNEYALLNDTSEDELVSVDECKNDTYRVTDYSITLLSDTLDALNEMLMAFYNATGSDGVLVRSGYQSFTYQQQLYEAEIASTVNDSSTAIARAGYSENHTGYAVDFATYSGSTYNNFDGTGEYSWIPENCYKFGYILRYPEGKEEYTLVESQPWHYRYVGAPHAQVMYDYDMCLEEYISYIKNYTIDTGFLLVNSYDGVQYIIYYVPLSDSDTTTIYVPLMDDGVTAYPYEISGNNVDGFIVTVKL